MECSLTTDFQQSTAIGIAKKIGNLHIVITQREQGQNFAQKLFTFFLNHIAKVFAPSDTVTKENPRKSPRQPPNSASREVKG